MIYLNEQFCECKLTCADAPWLHLPYGERPYHARWGDGADLSDAELATLSGLYSVNADTVPLETGELVVINNFRWTHGRRPYSGPRDILVMMSRSVQRRTAYAPILRP